MNATSLMGAGGAARLVLACAVAATLAAGEPVSAKIPAGSVAYWYGLQYLAGYLEFRDASGTKWPNTFYEKKQGDIQGSFVFDPKQARCAFTLNCTALVQRDGDQSLKVLGDVLTDTETLPKVALTIASIGAWQPPPSDGERRDGPPDPCESAELTGTLTLGARTVPVRGLGRFRYSLGQVSNGLAAGGQLTGLRVALKADFDIAGKDLGLTSVERVQLRLVTHAYDEANILAAGKGKTLEQMGVRK